MVKKEINTEIKINATPEKVWETLTNFDCYPNWNPFIKSIIGQVKVNNIITVSIEPPKAKKMTFKPKVITFETNKEFSWLGKLLFTGLFDGEHKFELVDNKNESTTLKQSEIFKGILVPLFARQLENNTKNGFELMNQKLKELTERK